LGFILFAADKRYELIHDTMAIDGKKPIIITGGQVIGSHLTERLIGRGCA